MVSADVKHHVYLRYNAATEVDQPHNAATEVDQPHNAATEVDQPHNAATEVDQPHLQAVKQGRPPAQQKNRSVTVQFKIVSMRSEKPIASPSLSDVTCTDHYTDLYRTRH